MRVPFATIYTSVFLIECDKGNMLVDCATTAHDVDSFIVPSLNALGYEFSNIKKLVLTHHHSDHSGGLARILELAPDIETVRDIQSISSEVVTYPMAGHTKDSIGILDERTNTLISGDGLQGAGVDKYPCYTQDSQAYIRTLERIKDDERIENLLLSHSYAPWNKDVVKGRENVIQCLNYCLKYIKEKL